MGSVTRLLRPPMEVYTRPRTIQWATSYRSLGIHAQVGEDMVRVKVTGRPTLDDVQRLARGQRAKKRGTGSRGVPHRLNEEELKAFNISKSSSPRESLLVVLSSNLHTRPLPTRTTRTAQAMTIGRWRLLQDTHYLVMKGTGVRRTRRLGNNNPAFNIYRQLCDVYGWPAIYVEK
eukprot:7721296-Pyramimonas_sp.AAC.1